jgi:hypothetical protein
MDRIRIVSLRREEARSSNGQTDEEHDRNAKRYNEEHTRHKHTLC